jgi:hypothetical protein
MVFDPWPNRPAEPPPDAFDDVSTQQVREIAVTGPGYAMLANRRPPASTQQVNIIGQLSASWRSETSTT